MKNCKKIVTIFLCLLISLTAIVSSGEIKAQAYSTSHPNTYVNTGNQIEDLIGVAMTQVGYYGTTGTGTKYGAWFAPNMTYQPWCGLFVSWCANQAGIPTSIIKKTGRSTLYKYSGTYHYKDGYIPQRGDLVLYNPTGSGGYYWPSKDSDGTYSISSHVAIVCSYDAKTGKIWIVHGNSTGSKVCYNSIEVSKTAIQAFVTPPYTTGPTTAPEYDYVNGSAVRMRSGPGTEYDILGQFNVGTSVEVLGAETSEAKEKWYKVKILSTGAIGYIRSDFITVVNKSEATEPVKTYAGYVNATNVHLRSGAGTTNSIIGNYSTGTKITVLDTTTNAAGETWYKVQINGTSNVGYMISDYITITMENTDSILPEGELVSVTDVNKDGYTITVTATDDKAISNVLFTTVAGTITKNANGASLGGDTYAHTIKTSQFATANQDYTTTVTAVDTSGNCEIIAMITFNPATYSPVIITYNLNGGSGNVSSTYCDFFGNAKITEATPVKDKCIFLGWSTTKNGAVEYKSGENFTFQENIQLYAVWCSESAGDFNLDGEIDTIDLSILKLYLCGNYNNIASSADMDSNGIIDTTDMALLKLKLAGA